MPELPEVEGFRALLERHLVGRRIVRARFLDAWMLKGISPSAAARRLTGTRVSTIDRKGKLLAAFTDPRRDRRWAPVLAMHFGMTGRPVVDDGPSHPWDRLVLELSDGGRVRYRNARRLGSLRVVTRNELADIVWGLGPDPLEVPASFLREALTRRSASIKAVLLDQSFLAGVGNIYADEALHAAGIRPDRRASDLEAEEVTRLHRALSRILRRAVKAHRDGRDALFPIMALRGRASRQLGASGRTVVGCPRCDRPLRHARIGGRTSFYCTRCQC